MNPDMCHLSLLLLNRLQATNAEDRASAPRGSGASIFRRQSSNAFSKPSESKLTAVTVHQNGMQWWWVALSAALCVITSGCAVPSRYEIHRYWADWNTERACNLQCEQISRVPADPTHTRLYRYGYNVINAGMPNNPYDGGDVRVRRGGDCPRDCDPVLGFGMDREQVVERATGPSRPLTTVGSSAPTRRISGKDELATSRPPEIAELDRLGPAQVRERYVRSDQRRIDSPAATQQAEHTAPGRRVTQANAAARPIVYTTQSDRSSAVNQNTSMPSATNDSSSSTGTPRSTPVRTPSAPNGTFLFAHP